MYEQKDCSNNRKPKERWKQLCHDRGFYQSGRRKRTQQKADVVVLTMPVYWYSIPAQIKGVIDRLYSFCVAGKDIAGKECALITCCEEDDMSVMDGVRMPMERTAALLKWKMMGEVLITGVFNTGDIEKTDGCQKAAALADKI